MTMASPDPAMLHLLDLLASNRIWLMAAYALCSSCLLILEVRASPTVSPARTSRRLLFFALLSLAFFVLIRAPTVFYNAPFNPDEAEMLANARKFTIDMNSWRSVDTSSGGPLDSFVLMWPGLIGQSPSFATARVTAMVLLFSAWLALLGLPGQAKGGSRIAALTSLMLFLGGTRMTDYMHYSSEILPLSLLTFVLALMARMVDRPADLRLATLAAVLLGSVPFTKLQATPPALFLGLALAWLTARSRTSASSGLSRLAMLFAAALLPAILILGPLVVTGDFDNFWKSYIGFALGYLQGGVGKSAPVTTIRILKALFEPNRLVQAYFAAMAGLTVIGVIVNFAGIRRPSSPAFVLFAIGSGLFASSLFAAMTPGRPFFAYGNFLLMPAAALAVLAWSLEPASRAATSMARERRWLAPVGIGSILLVVCGAALNAAGLKNARPELYDVERTDFAPAVMAPESFFGSGDVIPDLLDKDRRVLIWGWMGQWYVQSTAIPATRDMLSYNQTWPGLLRPYFRDRMMSDLRQASPRFILDAVAPGSFYYQDAAREGLSSFPALKRFVDAAYVQISHSPPGAACPRTFIRKDALAELNARYAPVRAISASAFKVADGLAFTPDHVLDGVMFETCPDRWLLPDHQLGSVSLDLTAPRRLRSIEMLNTRNGESKDRATRSVKISGWSGTSELWVRRVDLKRYPYWTRVAVAPDTAPVSRVTIAVESFAGAGGGLNEVRLVQAPL